jgi:hypothetical protein
MLSAAWCQLLESFVAAGDDGCMTIQN